MMRAVRALVRVLFSLSLLVACSKCQETDESSSVVKVVLVGGQSNCQGLGDKFHLLDLLASGDVDSKYGNGTDVATREDVTVWIQPERGTLGPLTAKFGDSKRKFGIEMGMGWTLGDYFQDNDVFIVKHCEVLPLATGWRPPSSGEASFNNTPEEITVGSAYQNAIATFSRALENTTEFLPEATRVDPLMFVWFHGYADVFEKSYRNEYESNLAKLIGDIQDEFPKLKGSVIVQMGGGGRVNATGPELAMRVIQANVANNNPKLAPTTVLVRTAQYATQGPAIDGEVMQHCCGRAESYINIGEAIGTAMVDHLETTNNATLAPETPEPSQSLNSSNTTASPTESPAVANETASSSSPTTAPPTQSPPPLDVSEAPTTAAPTTNSPVNNALSSSPSPTRAPSESQASMPSSAIANRERFFSQVMQVSLLAALFSMLY